MTSLGEETAQKAGTGLDAQAGSRDQLRSMHCLAIHIRFIVHFQEKANIIKYMVNSLKQ